MLAIIIKKNMGQHRLAGKRAKKGCPIKIVAAYLVWKMVRAPAASLARKKGQTSEKTGMALVTEA